MESASVALGHDHDDEHHGPPPANQSSRVEAQFLGMLLFIISEVMLFGAFFTAYFFIRVVGNAEWPAAGTELPKSVAGVNTAILISSSFTMHWALEGARNENRAALRVGRLTTLPAGPDVPARADQRVRAPRLRPAGPRPGPNSTAHRPARPPRVRRPGAALVRTDPGLPGRLLPKEHRGVEVPGIYWHFVDVMWIVVYTTIYVDVINPLRSEQEAFRFLLCVAGCYGRDRGRRAGGPGPLSAASDLDLATRAARAAGEPPAGALPRAGAVGWSASPHAPTWSRTPTATPRR